MIGVLVHKDYLKIAREFFELLKTPWEYYRPGSTYNVILVNGLKLDHFEDLHTGTVIIFEDGSSVADGNKFLADTVPFVEDVNIVECSGTRYPIFKKIAVSKAPEDCYIVVRSGDSQYTVGFRVDTGSHTVYRIGYDLLEEVRFLLTEGQPAKLANYPTLDIHIQNLRNWIVQAGNTLIEIPPVPPGYDFMACLTHDVDFAGIRNHFFDRTMFGFVYRALIESIARFLKRELSLIGLIKNWGAVAKLPLVYLGLSEDFWFQFDHYTEIEKGLCPTFYFLPFKNKPGRGTGKAEQKLRAGKYDVDALGERLKTLRAKKCEIGLHGIDAWQNAKKGAGEGEKIMGISGDSEIGVRMHWLYFKDETPKILENAGFVYDSTLVYNETVGYRNGTTQSFRPEGAKSLMELPLHIQDTAMFYGKRMGLRRKQALKLCKEVISNNLKYGGVLVLNWHHRSLAPERQWKDFYLEILDYLSDHKVWYGTGKQITKWFQKRRSVKFEAENVSDFSVTVKYESFPEESVPQVALRLTKASDNDGIHSSCASQKFSVREMPFNTKKSGEITIRF